MKQTLLSHRTLRSAIAGLLLIVALIGASVYARGDRNQRTDVVQIESTTSTVAAMDAVDDVNDTTESAVEEAQAEPSNEAVDVAKTTVAESPKTETAKTTTTNSAAEPDSSATVTTSQKTETAKSDTPAAESAVEQYTATLTVRGPAGAVHYAVDVDVGATVQDLMKAAAAKGFSFKTKNFSGLGAYVTTVNGITEDTDAGMYWTYSVNNKKATSGISSKVLKKGDSVQWSYEKAL